MITRVQRIQTKLAKDEALIIFGGANRFYFTGFSSSAGTVLITGEKAYFLIDFRYFEKAKQTVKSAEVLLCNKLYFQINELLKKHSIKTVFFETQTLSFSSFIGLCKNLEGAEISKDSTMQNYITNLRSIKENLLFPINGQANIMAICCGRNCAASSMMVLLLMPMTK